VLREPAVSHSVTHALGVPGDDDSHDRHEPVNAHTPRRAHPTVTLPPTPIDPVNAHARNSGTPRPSIQSTKPERPHASAAAAAPFPSIPNDCFTQIPSSIHTGLHAVVKRKPPHVEQVKADFADFTLSQRREVCRDTYLHEWSETRRESLAYTPPYERCKTRKICKIETDSPVSRLELPNLILHFFASGVKSGNVSVKSVAGVGE